jgi:hypothetical protein
MNNRASLTPAQGTLTVACMIVTSLSQLPHGYHQLPTVGKSSENTNLHTKFLLQIWKQWQDSAMLLASNKQQHKEITKNRKTQQDRQNTQKRTAGKNKDQVGLQEAPHLQDYTESFRILQMLKFQKGIFLIEKPCSPFIQNL